MSPFSRTALPADLRDRVATHLGAGPRVLAWGRTPDGAVVALADRMLVVSPESVDELGWHDVLHGAWDDAGKAMTWTRMSTGERTVLPLPEPHRFPEVFKERVESTFLFQQVVTAQPGRALTISARRNLMDEREPVLWTVHPARGVRMDDETLAFAQAEVARLRAEYAF